MPQQTSQYTAADIQRAIERAQTPRWAKCRQQIDDEAAALFEQGIDVPEFDSSWYDPAQPYSETYQQFHGYVSQHRDVYFSIRQQALIGLVLRNDGYRRQAFDVALSIAEALNFDIMHYDSGMEFGIVGNALIDATLGADDLLTVDEKARAHRQLREVADAVTRCNDYWREHLSRMAFNNHLICHQGSRIALGAILGDNSLIDPAFDPADDRYLLNYLNGACYDDGLCYESSILYHYTTALFLIQAAMTQRALLPDRPDLFRLAGADGRNIESYLRGPLALLFRNLELPRIGDSYAGDMSVLKQTHYTIAHAIYGNPIYTRIAQEQEHISPLLALMFGPEKPTTTELPTVVSRIFPEHGYTLLRDDNTIHKQAFLTGDRSGIHHQRDSLQLQVQLGDERVLGCTDIRAKSAHGFSDSIQDDFNRWPQAHSQLAIDDLDQKTHASPISIREWSTGGRIQRMAMVDEHEQLQDGIHQGRFVSMSDDWICDCVIASAATERTWRLFYHLPQGTDSSAFQSDFALQSSDQTPWRFFKCEGSAPAQLFHRIKSGKAYLTISGGREFALQHFTVPEYTPGREGIWAEQRSQHAVFITLMSPNDANRVSDVSLQVLGNELVARWLIQSEEHSWMQARINLV
ncbi:hypothetical protein [Cerasicoccus maritimus]|uniref:hypothetical protein n=1 Tax=Cerasicoccus maritimus TaxID=490089 RepID=UPI002852CCA4|nr:hypothetical protein [Cerasicoccus maritimus]